MYHHSQSQMKTILLIHGAKRKIIIIITNISLYHYTARQRHLPTISICFYYVPLVSSFYVNRLINFSVSSHHLMNSLPLEFVMCLSLFSPSVVLSPTDFLAIVIS